MTRRTTIVPAASVTVLALVLSLSAVPAGAEVKYTLTDLGRLPGLWDSQALGINNQGQVIGTSSGQAFIWSSSGGMTPLGNLPGVSGATPTLTTGWTYNNASGLWETTTTHTYQTVGGYNIAATATDADQSIHNTNAAAVSVMAPTLHMSSTAGTFVAAQGIPNTDVVIARFSDTRTNPSAGDYTVTVAWGDGTTDSSTGSAPHVSVVVDPYYGGFDVIGSHTYAKSGQYALSVTISVTGNPGNCIAAAGTLAADFNNDGIVDGTDIDLLYAHFGQNATYDLTGDLDHTVDQSDVDYLVKTVLQSYYGDANLDGEVEFADFQVLLENWCTGSGWAQGDWNGDGLVDFAEFQTLLENWGWAQLRVNPLGQELDSQLVNTPLYDVLVATFTDPDNPNGITQGCVSYYNVLVNWGDGTQQTGGSVVYNETNQNFEVYADKLNGYSTTGDKNITVAVRVTLDTDQNAFAYSTVSIT